MKKAKQRYYLPFLAGPIGLGVLPISWVDLGLSTMIYAMLAFNHISPLDNFFKLFALVGLVSLLLTFIKKVLYTFQVATLSLVAINLFILLVDIDVIAVLMFNSLSVGIGNLLSWYSIMYMVILLLTVIGSTLYYVHCYRVKKERVLGYGGKGKKNKEKSKTKYGIIFGIVLAAPFLLMGYIDNVIGFCVGLLLSVVWPGTVIDAIYAAYYTYKHPDYREERRHKTKL